MILSSKSLKSILERTKVYSVSDSKMNRLYSFNIQDFRYREDENEWTFTMIFEKLKTEVTATGIARYQLFIDEKGDVLYYQDYPHGNCKFWEGLDVTITGGMNITTMRGLV